MDYTDEQYALMEKLSERVLWDNLSDQEKELIPYLDREQIAQPRADIEDGLWTLSPHGKRTLETHRQKMRSAKIQIQRELQELQNQELIRQENVRRENAQEQKRLQQAIAGKAERNAEKRADRKFQLALTLINTVFSFLLGLLAEHFAGIIDFIAGFFG